MESGIYIVSLNNCEPISVNANDARIAHKTIKVTKENCKFGKAKSLKAREKNYFKVFGEENVNFLPIAFLENIDHAEKVVLLKLDRYRLKGRTGRKNEWLKGVSAAEVEKIAFKTLDETGIFYLKAK